ncbi:MAG: hypothetical protein KGM47_06010 [Acidobacteriota bacterium]|nr:hypothetical protein [Acidobacteriota bacterium]
MMPILLAVILLFAAVCSPLQAAPAPSAASGFRLLYEARFAEARSQFLELERAAPQDPLNFDWVAASYLFEEFYRDGVLTSRFFLNDNRFLNGVTNAPDRDYRTGFYQAASAARQLAEQCLAKNPKDRDALLALTLAAGMQADYTSVIERRQLESLKLIREAMRYAKSLLAVDPDAADAFVALGSANYIIGSLPAPKRIFAWFYGDGGNKQLGIQQLNITAASGVYLRPFAKLLLALVDLREGLDASARAQLAALASEFPENPLFARELALAALPRQRGH